MKPKRPQGNIVIAGVGCPLGSFADALFATPADAKKPVIIKLHATVKTNRERAYDMAIAGGCKSTTPILNGHGRKPLTAGCEQKFTEDLFKVTSRDGAAGYSRQATKVITGAVTDFASHFKPSDSWRRRLVARQGQQHSFTLS